MFTSQNVMKLLYTLQKCYNQILAGGPDRPITRPSVPTHFAISITCAWQLNLFWSLRFIFFRAVLALYAPTFNKKEYLPECSPTLPDSVLPMTRSSISAVQQLADIFGASTMFNFTEGFIFGAPTMFNFSDGFMQEV